MHDFSGFASRSCGVAVVDRCMTILAANPSLASLLHYPDDTLPGMPLKRFFPDITVGMLVESGLRSHLMHYDDHPFLMSFVPFPEGDDQRTAIFVQDVDNINRIYNDNIKLNEDMSLLDQMFNALYDGIFITDKNGIAIYANDALLSFLGIFREDCIGKPVAQLVEEGVSNNAASMEVLNTSAPASTINSYPRSGKTCLASATPVFADGVLKRVICVIRDLSELNALRDRLNEVQSLTRGYRQRLKEMEAVRSAPAIVATRSSAMQEVFAMAAKVASVDVPVLLLGETGVGKDFLAQFIHDNGDRGRQGSLIKVNCGAIPETLLESELFGYEQGAFTGASRQGKAGLFEVAKGGTLFLDEIGEIPRAMQVKLLNVLQDRKFYRLGGVKTIELQTRIIAATNANIEKMVEDGSFRKDLFHRLNVITLWIPALRDRYDDILPLAMAFLKENNVRYGRCCSFSSETMEAFLRYDWPGNIREMKNAVERLVIMSNEECIRPANFAGSLLPPRRGEQDWAAHPAGDPSLTLKQRVDAFEANCIESAVAQAGTLRDAARLLDIDLSTLVRKRQRLGLRNRDGRRESQQTHPAIDRKNLSASSSLGTA